MHGLQMYILIYVLYTDLSNFYCEVLNRVKVHCLGNERLAQGGHHLVHGTYREYKMIKQYVHT